jgi:hypothetical protein
MIAVIAWRSDDAMLVMRRPASPMRYRDGAIVPVHSAVRRCSRSRCALPSAHAGRNAVPVRERHGHQEARQIRNIL